MNSEVSMVSLNGSFINSLGLQEDCLKLNLQSVRQQMEKQILKMARGRILAYLFFFTFPG